MCKWINVNNKCTKKVLCFPKWGEKTFRLHVVTNLLDILSFWYFKLHCHAFKTRTSSLLACYQQCSAWEVTVRWPWCGGPLATDTVRTFVVFSRPSLSHSKRLSGDSDLQPPSPLNPHFPAHTCCFPGNRAGAPLVWPGRLPWQPALPIRISLKNNNRLATQSLHISRANPMSDHLNNWTKWEPMSPTYMCTAGIYIYIFLSIN